MSIENIENYALTYLGAFTGLRRNEVLALRFQDIEWFVNEIRIRHAISKRRGRDGAHKVGMASRAAEVPQVAPPNRRHRKRDEDAGGSQTRQTGRRLDPRLALWVSNLRRSRSNSTRRSTKDGRDILVCRDLHRTAIDILGEH
jgi:integrase